MNELNGAKRFRLNADTHIHTSELLMETSVGTCVVEAFNYTTHNAHKLDEPLVELFSFSISSTVELECICWQADTVLSSSHSLTVVLHR